MAMFQIVSLASGKSFSVGSVIEAQGNHSIDPNSSVWAILQDVYGHYYLENPPVALKPDGSWHTTNIHLGHDIVKIIFVRTMSSGNSHLLSKVKNQEWGAFDAFPAETKILGSVNVRV